MNNHPIIIIGSGLAAYMLAKELRKLDAHQKLILVTAQDGRFYSKPLLSTALAQQKSPEVLAVSSAAEMEQELQTVILTHTTVERIDPEKKVILLENGESLAYSQLVLACGAELLHAPLKGDAVQQVLSVNHLEDYALFRAKILHKKKIAILGSGLVGCEFANDLCHAGYEVNVISPEERPLQRLIPAEISEVLRVAFTQAGIQWQLNRFVTEVNAVGDAYQLKLSDETVMRVDGVLSAVGLKPNLHLAKSAGLITRNGIVVDQALRTSIPNIYALGDCAEVMGQVCLYVAPLLHCARVLAKVLLGEGAAVQYPIMPIVIKTPLCPIAVQLPPAGVEPEWKFSGSGGDRKALAYEREKLIGFALSGSCVKERVALAKEMMSS